MHHLHVPGICIQIQEAIYQGVHQHSPCLLADICSRSTHPENESSRFYMLQPVLLCRPLCISEGCAETPRVCFSTANHHSGLLEACFYIWPLAWAKIRSETTCDQFIHCWLRRSPDNVREIRLAVISKESCQHNSLQNLIGSRIWWSTDQQSWLWSTHSCPAIFTQNI